MGSSEPLTCEECGAIFSTIEALDEQPKEKTKNCVMLVLPTVSFEQDIIIIDIARLNTILSSSSAIESL